MRSKRKRETTVPDKCLDGKTYLGTDKEEEIDFHAEVVGETLELMWTPGRGEDRHHNLHQLGLSFLEFVKSDEVITFEQFYSHQMIVGRSFRRWCKECPLLNICAIKAKEIIGERRERFAMLGKLNHKMVMHSQRNYGQVYRQIEQDRVDMKYASMKDKGVSCVKIPVYLYNDKDEKRYQEEDEE